MVRLRTLRLPPMLSQPLSPPPSEMPSTAPPRFKRSSRRKSSSTQKPTTTTSLSPDGTASIVLTPTATGALPLLIPSPPPPFPSSPILPADFFLADALDLAPRLLGKLLRRDAVALRITEVEAYRSNDSACHGRFGVTARTAALFGPGGHAYVYLCYGMHMMLNVVADEEGVGAAVLIRSCAPVCGLDIIQERRGQKTDKPVLLAGPGKVGQALGLSTAWSSHPLYIPGGLEILDGPQPENILVGPRVGINYASPEHVAAPWRFAVADSPWISAPKNTLRQL